MNGLRAFLAIVIVVLLCVVALEYMRRVGTWGFVYRYHSQEIAQTWGAIFCAAVLLGLTFLF